MNNSGKADKNFSNKINLFIKLIESSKIFNKVKKKLQINLKNGNAL